MTNTKSQRGTLALTALILPAIVLVVALVLYSSMAPSGATRVRSFVNHLALTAIKEYSYHQCSDSSVVSACHSEKLDQALFAVRALAERNRKLIGDAEVLLAQSDGDLFLEPLRYYHDGTNVTGCTGSPCLTSPALSEIATAMRVTGIISSEQSSVLGLATQLFGINQTLNVDVGAAATITPMDLSLLIDYSPSVAEETYLSEGGIPQPPSIGDPSASYFAYQVSDIDGFGNHSGTFNPITDLTQTNWNNVPVTRAIDDDSSDPYHFQSDYTQEVWSFGAGLSGWNLYGATYNKYHPMPSAPGSNSASSPNILYTSSTDPVYHWIDAYGTEVRPEPFVSILTATLTIIQKLKERQVPQDYFSMIFFSHYLSWSSVIDMTNDLSYLETLLTTALQGDSLVPLIPRSEFSSTPLYQDDYREPNNPNVPLIYRLGIFPTSEGFTDELLAYFEAAYQFRSIPGDRQSQKAVIHVGDIMNTCHRMPSTAGNTGKFPYCTGQPSSFPENCCFRPLSSTQCCRATYDVYKQGDADIDTWIADNFFKAGISLNIAQFGKSAGPHYKLITSAENPGNCMSQAEARASGKEFV